MSRRASPRSRRPSSSFGRVDCLVNSAGLTTRGTLLDTTPELFDEHIAVNLRAPFFLMQAAVKDMVARGDRGSIVNIITMSAHGGQPYLAPYVASKVGLVGLTRNAALAHRWDRIRINGLDIGWTETEGEDAIQRQFHGADDDWLEKAAASLPMGKLGQVDEIADFVGLPALRPQRRRHRVGHRLGPERPRRPRLMTTSPSSDRGRRHAHRTDRRRPDRRLPRRNLAALPVVELAGRHRRRARGRRRRRRELGATAGRARGRAGRGRRRRRHGLLDRRPPDLIRAACEAGLPTFCEKPVAADLRRPWPCAASSPTATSRSRSASRAASTRPSSRPATTWLAGELGYLHTVRSTTLDPAPPPEAYIAGSGGIFSDCAIHDFDSIRWVTGQEVVEVYAAGATQGDRLLAEAGDADTATVRAHPRRRHPRAWSPTPATTVAATTCAWSCTAARTASPPASTTRLPLRSADADVTFPAGEPCTFFMDRFADAFRAELAAFTEVVAGTRTSPCTVADGVEAALIAEAATVSFREHRPVRLEEIR